MKLPVGHVPGKGVHKASAYGGYGQRMLEQMGWEKGQGLGKSKDGITQAIEVLKKEDTLGVGAEQASWNWSWKYWEEAYNSAVQKVDHEGGGSLSSDSSDSDSDDGKAAAAKSKSKRKAKSKVQHNRDGTVASATQAELKLAATLAADPWGRWGGRGGKMARIREQEAAEAARMRASLGLPPLPPAPAPGADSDSSSDSSDSSGSESEGPEGKGRKGKAAGEAVQQQPQQPPKKKPLVVVLTIKEDPSRKKPVFVPTPATGWWGASYFASAGAMANLEDEAAEEGEEGAARAPRQRQAFDEGDQENLYMRVHDNQRVGKRGLGKSSTLKIAGGKWEGTKVTFEGDGGEEGKGGVAAAAAALMEVEVEVEEGRKGKGKKRKGGVEEGEGKVVEEEGKGKKEKKAKRESAAVCEVEGDEGGRKKKAKKGKSKAGGEVEVEPEVEPEVEGGKKKKVKANVESKAKEAKEAAQQQQQEQQGAVEPAPSKKWLKAACKLLKKAPEQRLKTRLLMQQLQAHGAALVPPEACVPSLASLTQLSSSDLRVKGSHLALQGKYVVLVGA